MAKAGPRALKSFDKAVRCLELRKQGKTYAEIHALTGISQTTVHDLVQKALQRTLEEPAAGVRALELERLDALWLKWFPRAQGNNKDAAAVCLRIMERRARLLGLDAPTTVQNPDGSNVGGFVVALPTQAPSVEAWQAAQVIETAPALSCGLEVDDAEQP